MHPGRHPRSESCDSKELSSSGSGSGSGCGPPSFATFARLVEGANATSRASRAEATSGSGSGSGSGLVTNSGSGSGSGRVVSSGLGMPSGMCAVDWTKSASTRTPTSKQPVLSAARPFLSQAVRRFLYTFKQSRKTRLSCSFRRTFCWTAVDTAVSPSMRWLKANVNVRLRSSRESSEGSGSLRDLMTSAREASVTLGLLPRLTVVTYSLVSSASNRPAASASDIPAPIQSTFVIRGSFAAICTTCSSRFFFARFSLRDFAAWARLNAVSRFVAHWT